MPPGHRLATVFAPGFKARVFYLRDRCGHSIAIVQADLLTGSRLVQHRVAEQVARSADFGVAK